MIKQYKSWDRPYKNVARLHAQPTKAAKNSLWLPGEACLDVQNAVDKRLLDPLGQHWLVEVNPETAEVIRESVSGYPVPFKLHLGWLVELELDRPLNYAHVDYCGGLDLETARWITGMPVAKGAEINFTFAYAPRNNLFIKRCHEIFGSNEEYHRILVREFSELARTDLNIAVYCCVLRCLLRRYAASVIQPTYYKDEIQSMVLYQFRDFRPTTKPVYPDLMREFRGVSSVLVV